MNTSLDCVPCLIRQALEAVRFVRAVAGVQESILRQLLQMLSEADFAQSPPLLAQKIHRRLRELTGVDDPYRSLKDRFNRMAMGVFPELHASVAVARDPLEMAVRLAIAGNVIDVGANGGLTELEVHLAVQQVLSQPFTGDVEAFRQAVGRAGHILYLADNAGEIVFDRLLIEQLPRGRITLAVRGRPIINDATKTDALAAGLQELCEVIDNGSDAPGTILDDCSPEFRKYFKDADLVLAKGQGNYETLSDEQANAFFLFKVKCQVIASRVGLPTGAHVMARNPHTL